MRTTRTAVCWLGVLLLGFMGCTTPEPNIKPTLREEYNIPPADDARFSQPPTFPKETLNAPLKREAIGPNSGFKGPGPSRGGMTGGMGGGY